MTLEDFNEIIVRPMVLNYIERGTFDNIIFGLDLDEVYRDNEIVMDAIKCRREFLLQQNFNQEEI